ncbi:MAG: PD40 domain-containing protein [Deltaproteobacteria bacterium]|nr:PD40 domain-containing protein [Deltaproteobacteria bacterium]
MNRTFINLLRFFLLISVLSGCSYQLQDDPLDTNTPPHQSPTQLITETQSYEGSPKKVQTETPTFEPSETKSASPTPRSATVTPTSEDIQIVINEKIPPGWISFVNGYENSVDIINTSGGGWRKIIDENGIYSNPAWSVDGQWLAFSFYDGVAPQTDIYIVKADGSEMENITKTASNEETPSWSPDNSIVYIQLKDNGAGTEGDIYSFDRNTKQVKQLTFSPNVIEHFPTYSPNGNTIAFLSMIDDDVFGNYHLMSIDKNGENMIQIIDIPVGMSKISWSPDGSKIAFRSLEGCGDIFIVNLDGSELEQLTTNPGRDKNPSWSPDGKFIAYNATTNCNDLSEGVAIGWQIYIIQSDGTNPTQLTNMVNAYPVEPTWSPLPAIQPGKEFFVTEVGAFLNLRSTPSLDGESIQKLKEGEKILVNTGPVEADGYLWWQVHVTSSGQEGWVVENPGWFNSVR